MAGRVPSTFVSCGCEETAPCAKDGLHAQPLLLCNSMKEGADGLKVVARHEFL